jgi:peptide chain release factor subunit 1
VNGASVVQAPAIGSSARTAARAANHVIERMLGFDAHGERVLTAYLQVNPGTDVGRRADTQLQAALQPLYAQLEDQQAAKLKLEEERVLGELARLEPGARGVAIFASAPAGLCLLAPLPLPAGPLAYWDERPHLRPLLALVDEFERTIVAITDHHRARFFRIFLDRIEEIHDVWDFVPKHHEQGGMAQSNIARRRDEAVKWHLRRVSNVLSQIVDEEGVDRIVLGGPPDVEAELRRLLPRRLRSRIIGALHVALIAPPIEILTRARRIMQQAERAYETERVQEVLEAVGRGQAALGRAPVAAAVAAGQVLLLLADAQQHANGYTCSACELVLADLNGGFCPACNGVVLERADFIEYLAERVIEQGGRFEEVRGDAAEQLAGVGGVAACFATRLRSSATGNARPLERAAARPFSPRPTTNFAAHAAPRLQMEET